MSKKELEERNDKAENEQRLRDLTNTFESKTHTDKRMKRNLNSNINHHKNQYYE